MSATLSTLSIQLLYLLAIFYVNSFIFMPINFFLLLHLSPIPHAFIFFRYQTPNLSTSLPGCLFPFVTLLNHVELANPFVFHNVLTPYISVCHLRSVSPPVSLSLFFISMTSSPLYACLCLTILLMFLCLSVRL